MKKINYHTFLSLKFPIKKYKANIHTLKIKYFKYFDSNWMYFQEKFNFDGLFFFSILSLFVSSLSQIVNISYY